MGSQVTNMLSGSAVMCLLGKTIEQIAEELGGKVFVNPHHEGIFVRYRRGEWFRSTSDLWAHADGGTCAELLAGLRHFFWLQDTGGLVVGVAGKRRSKFRRQAH